MRRGLGRPIFLARPWVSDRGFDCHDPIQWQAVQTIPDGKVNFATYRGYNLYASVCHVCHGHAGLGSSFAPSLVDSLKSMSYEDFVTVVMNGRQNITSATTNVMPSFGDNPSVVKYIDSINAYLKARSDGAIGDGDVLWEGPKDR